MPKKILPLVLLLLFLPSLFSTGPSVSSQSNTPVIITIEVDGPLTPILVGYIERSLDRARQIQAELIILQLNTPGGSIDLMNLAVQNIRSSEIPVVVYVAPQGAIAGSAGTLITLAGHVAAMAPETAIGAASPVGGQGEDLGTTIEAKQKEIMRATARSLAANRGPEAVSLAEATIEDAKAVSNEEALKAGLIDLVANSTAELITMLNGRTVTLHSGTRILNTSNAVTQEIPMSFIEQILQLLTNPNVLFLLLTIGVQAIFIELSNPGGWIAGFIGSVCLLLAIYGIGVLPVNWFGILFLALAFILFILDIKAPTHGALTVAGAASFIVGALVLFNTVNPPGFPRVSVPLVVITGIVLAAGVFVILSFALRAMRTPVQTGMESLIGRHGYVKTTLSPRGMVQVAGEEWGAETNDDSTIMENMAVQVIGKNGINLVVKQVNTISEE
jgi:membrane-bound serine protease (ClpP class)